jgi:vancomycin permeability regulator SanA
MLNAGKLKKALKDAALGAKARIGRMLRSRKIRILLVPLGLLVFATLSLLIIDFLIQRTGNHYTISRWDAPPSQAAIVLGAFVDQKGEPCTMLYDRILTGVELYRSGKVQKILMSGDHSLVDYDEVNSMRHHATLWGVPAEDIFMDHAGFCTYDSMYRARDIFRVKSAIVVTQKFHLPRAVYIARKLGIDAVGVSADRREYYIPEMVLLRKREILARMKAFYMVNVTKPEPFFLGEAIPIGGDGRATCDKKEETEK